MKPRRFLITTALEQTWTKDQPSLLLGEWCLIPPRRADQLAFDAAVMPYHWNDRSKLFADYQLVAALYETVLERLAGKLNELHGTSHSVRYWRILVGPWLGLFMLMLFDRWSSIQEAVKNYDLAGSIVLTGEEEDFIPNDMDDFNSLFSGDEWNHHIYARILEHIQTIPLDRQKRAERAKRKGASSSLSFKSKLKELLRSLAAGAGRPFTREDDALFLGTYLTRWEEMELSLRLGQYPLPQRSPAPPRVAADPRRRAWLLELDGSDGFQTCLQALLPQQLPRVYLEGYGRLTEQAQELPWPRRPKAIWTSNSFHSDDVFKVWAAAKVESGAPLIIGQHGGNYGMGSWNWLEQHEIAISDRYLTWGWSRPATPKVLPLGKIKYSRPVPRTSQQQSAILVTVMGERHGNATLPMPIASQWLYYLQDQFDFMDALPAQIRDRLIIRLSQPDYGWRQVERWRGRYPALEIDDGVCDMNQLIRRSRLYISTYNATTYLESMSMDVPTVTYWNPRYMELNEWAKPYFEELQAVGIFHESPQSAALHVARVWENVQGWWKSPETAAARDRFMRQFAYCPQDKIARLKRAIEEVAVPSRPERWPVAQAQGQAQPPPPGRNIS